MELLLPDKPIKALEDSVIFPHIDCSPTLAAILKTNASADEKAYLNSICRKAEEYKVNVQVIYANNPIETSSAIVDLRESHSINGIIVLSSYGKEADYALHNMIPTRLDIDCVSNGALGLLMGSSSTVSYRIAPCAPIAVVKLLDYSNIDVTNKNVAILGRSLRVGRPLAEILCKKDANVTVYHSKSTFDLRNFDIVISAIGKAKKIKADQFDKDKHYILIDVGINVDENGKLCGDFDIESFKDMNVKITPVPGCIGPIATVSLFTKLYANAADLRGEIVG